MSDETNIYIEIYDEAVEKARRIMAESLGMEDEQIEEVLNRYNFFTILKWIDIVHEGDRRGRIKSPQRYFMSALMDGYKTPAWYPDNPDSYPNRIKYIAWALPQGVV